VEEFWPGVPVMPFMQTGATDGLYVRNAGIPVYGVAAIFEDPADIRAHGRDERISVARFYEALEFWYRMIRAFAS
jgi:acetylornithine deacetylase/succinyl-diaminopimelate desuccinylase-like protein